MSPATLTPKCFKLFNVFISTCLWKWGYSCLTDYSMLFLKTNEFFYCLFQFKETVGAQVSLTGKRPNILSAPQTLKIILDSCHDRELNTDYPNPRLKTPYLLNNLFFVLEDDIKPADRRVSNQAIFLRKKWKTKPLLLVNVSHWYCSTAIAFFFFFTELSSHRSMRQLQPNVMMMMKNTKELESESSISNLC